MTTKTLQDVFSDLKLKERDSCRFLKRNKLPEEIEETGRLEDSPFGKNDKKTGFSPALKHTSENATQRIASSGTFVSKAAKGKTDEKLEEQESRKTSKPGYNQMMESQPTKQRTDPDGVDNGVVADDPQLKVLNSERFISPKGENACGV